MWKRKQKDYKQKPVEMEDTKETAGPMHAGTHRDQGRMHRARPEGVPSSGHKLPPLTNRVSVMTPAYWV